MESPESEKKTEQPDARKVDLRNIPEALKVLRAELASQQAMEKAARDKHPWKYSEWRAKKQKFSRWGIGNEDGSGQVISGFVQYWHHPGTFKLIVEARNLNPARLKVAEESIEAAELWNEPPPARLHIDAKMTVVFLRFAADLLGLAWR
jgi:hypothetical protein